MVQQDNQLSTKHFMKTQKHQGKPVAVGAGRLTLPALQTAARHFCKHVKAICFLLLAGFLLTGCATQSHTVAKPPAGPTLAEVQAMVQNHVSDSTIISLIETSSTRYHLTADQIISLKHSGVSDAVLNALINTASKAPAQTTSTTVAPSPYPYAYPYAYPYVYVDPWPVFWWGWGPHYHGYWR